MNPRIKNAFLGFLIGATMSIPAVSGGTTAIALGCYEPILSAAANLRRKESLQYLLSVGLGGILGFFSVASLVNKALLQFPVAVTMAVCAAAVTGIFLIGKEALTQNLTFNGILCFLLGVGTVLATERLPNGLGSTSPLLTVLWGAFLALGIILPGISTSHLLLAFGLYDDVTEISTMQDLFSLFPLAVGVGIGILFLTKPIARLLEKFPTHCRFALLGFATGSLKPLILPCVEHVEKANFPWYQGAAGVILSMLAVWGILHLNRTKKKLKKL